MDNNHRISKGWCDCESIITLIGGCAASLSDAEVEALGRATKTWVARELGWITTGELTGRDLRGCGGRRKRLDSIVRIERTRGAKRSGRISKYNLYLSQVWALHMKAVQPKSRAHLEQHLGESLPGQCIAELRLQHHSQTVDRMWSAVEKLNGDWDRKPSVLGKRALAGLAWKSEETVTKTVWREQHGCLNKAKPFHPNEAILPPALPGAPRILLDLEKLERIRIAGNQ